MGIPSEELLEFLGQPVPRQIPRRIWKETASSIGFGYIMLTMVLCFCSIFQYVFFPWHLQELALDLGTPATVIGKVTHVHKRSAKYNNNTIYDAYYEFQPPNGGLEKGWSCAQNKQPKIGSSVMVEYVADLPWINRVKGASRNPFGYGGAFVIIFEIIPLYGLWYVFRTRRQKHNLLVNGSLGAGQVTEVKQTNVTVNNARRYKVTVSYDTELGPQVSTYNAYRDEVRLARRKMDTATPVGILYNPDKPAQVLVVDSLMRAEDIPMNDAASATEISDEELYSDGD